VLRTAQTETFSKLKPPNGTVDALAMSPQRGRRVTDAGVPVRGYVSMCFGDTWRARSHRRRSSPWHRRLYEMGCAEISLGDTIGVATPGQVVELLDPRWGTQGCRSRCRRALP